MEVRECMAEQCPLCETRFCGWCFAVFGNADETHAHVRQCALSEARGELYATAAQWETCQRKRRQALVREYIASLPVDVDRVALRVALRA